MRIILEPSNLEKKEVIVKRNSGISLELVNTQNSKYPYKYGLYLGQDTESKKALIPTDNGFEIVDVSTLESGSFSYTGSFNVRSEKRVKDELMSLTYVVFDITKNGVSEVLVPLSKNDGVWKFKQKIEKPSWQRSEE